MMMTEMDIETSVYYVHLTRLIAREDFIKFTRRESTKTYTVGFVTKRLQIIKKDWYNYRSSVSRFLKALIMNPM
jgi:hypothetical protein